MRRKHQLRLTQPLLSPRRSWLDLLRAKLLHAELVHCRWAMLGAAGIFIPKLLTKIGILNTPSWYTAGSATYFADQGTLFIVELLLFAWAKSRRWADIARPGIVNMDPIFPN
jgi:light-harvesting complex I chlorophyll a/b binding protein 2